MELKFTTFEDERDLDRNRMYIQHIPMFGMSKSLFIEVNSPEEAWSVALLIWKYDLFQYDNDIKPDYINRTDLIYWNDNLKKWDGWQDDEGSDFREHFEREELV